MQGLVQLCILLFCGSTVTLTLQAQETIEFEFTAELDEITDPFSVLGSDVELGDLVVGRLVLLKGSAPTSINSAKTRADYDLNDGSSFMSFNVRNRNYYSVTLPADNTKPSFHGLTGLLSSPKDKEEPKDSCGANIQFKSFHNIFHGSSAPTRSNIYIYLQTKDCDFSIDVQKLPTELDLQDWERAFIRVNNNGAPSGSSYAFTAKLRTLRRVVEDGGTISGQLVADYNGNCSKDADDIGLARRIVKFTPGPYYSVTDAAGQYEVSLPYGTYTATVLAEELWGQSCTSGAENLTISEQNSELEANLYKSPKELIEKLKVRIIPGFPRPGFEMRYTIAVQNAGTLPFNGMLTFTHDELLTGFVSEPAALTYQDAAASWELEDLAVDAMVRITVSLQVPADESLLGTQLCAEVRTALLEPDGEILNAEKSDRVCQIIRGSYDPNDKQVFSGQRNADGEIQTDDLLLRYLIRFQNEGNAEALTVRVRDQISEHLNIDRITLHAASHDCTFDLTKSGVLEWTFENINLPPKSQDEAGSMGFVSFDIALHEELPVGTRIPNQAEIYFDANAAIVTNTVESRIASATTSIYSTTGGPRFTISPNPGVEELVIDFEESGEARILVHNLLGEIILDQTFNTDVVELDLRTFSTGKYFLTVTTSTGTTSEGFSIIR